MVDYWPQSGYKIESMEVLMPSRSTIVLIFALLACLILWAGTLSFSGQSERSVHNVDELESPDDFTRSLGEIILGLGEMSGGSGDD